MKSIIRSIFAAVLLVFGAAAHASDTYTGTVSLIWIDTSGNMFVYLGSTAHCAGNSTASAYVLASDALFNKLYVGFITNKATVASTTIYSDANGSGGCHITNAKF